MSAPDRPTREQVEDAMQRAAIANLPWTLALAAEVRALRAELDGLRIGLDVETRRADDWQRVADGLAEDAARAAGVARTPQPAEQLRPDTLQIVRNGPGSGCPRVEGRCPACRARSLFLGAGARITCASLSCTDPCAVDAYLDPAPLPAVPDGEDALEPDAADPDDVRQALRGRDEAADEVEQLRDQLDRAHALNRKQHRELVELTMVPPPPFGEDVPDRLDAAADALAAFPDDINAKQARRHLRRAADWLNVPSPAPVRAAVAAALARPTERER